MIGCRPFTDNEVSLIVNSFTDKRDKTLFLLNFYTGFRIQESLSLYVKDVYENDHVKDRVSIQRRSTKGKGAGRTVLLHPKAKECILELVKEQDLGQDNYLFQSRKGLNRPISRVQAWRSLNKVIKKLKLEGKVALHSTRKSFAERMYESLDKDLVKTSKALGHKNIMSTASYLSFKTEELDNAILEMKEIK